MTAVVFYNQDSVAEVGHDWYEKLKRQASLSENKRARLCLHHSPDDPLHQMVVVFHRDVLIRPHRQCGRSESYHMIFGELDILLFEEDGRPMRLVHLGDASSGKSQIYHMQDQYWHTVIVRSEYAAIHEITNGPFRTNLYAPWAPEDPDELRGFLVRSVEAVTLPSVIQG
jgi:cupin fold WbuC family metalloprotein